MVWVCEFPKHFFHVDGRQRCCNLIPIDKLVVEGYDTFYFDPGILLAYDLLTVCASPEADGTDYVEYNKYITSNDYMVSSVHRDASAGRSVTMSLPRVVDRIPLLRKSVSSRVI